MNSTATAPAPHAGATGAAPVPAPQSRTNRLRALARRPFVTAGLLAVVAVAIAFARPDFELISFSKAVVYAVAILGLSVVVGFSGQLSLAQGAFVGLGAYTGAILVADYNWPILATIPVAAVLGFLAGCLLGLPALRVKGHYLATMTLGLAIVFPMIIKRYSDFTGGANGKLARVDLTAPEWLALTNTQFRFLVICAIAGLCFLFVSNIARSRVGRAMALIRSNESAALSNGIAVRKQRVLAFGYAGLLGAVAGPLLIMVLEVAGPDDYALLFTILLTTGLIVGGVNSLWGALIGGGVIAFLPSFTADVVGGPQANILYAIVLIAMVFLLPGGLASLPAAVPGWIARYRERGSARTSRTAAQASDTSTSPTPTTQE